MYRHEEQVVDHVDAEILLVIEPSPELLEAEVVSSVVTPYRSRASLTTPAMASKRRTLWRAQYRPGLLLSSSQ